MTAADVVLAGFSATVLVFHYLTDRRWTAERTRLLNAALANHSADFAQRQLAAGQDEPKRRTANPGDKVPRPTAIGL